MLRFPFKSPRSLLFLIAVFPFLVGFDTPDSAGTYLGLGGGHGTYHLVGCKGKFDSDFWEGQMSVKHRFASDSASSGSFWSRMKPGHNTVGTFVDALAENVTVLAVNKDTNGVPFFPDSVGSTFEKRGFAGGLYWTGDWRWVGLTVGWCGLYRSSQIPDLDVQNFAQPILGLRFGNYDRFYGSLEAYSSSPTLVGGGVVNVGLGGKWRSTRLWVGTGRYPGKQKDQKDLGVLKLSQGMGPFTLSLVAQGSGQDVPPANLGIDHEGGLSLSLQYRLPD